MGWRATIIGAMAATVACIAPAAAQDMPDGVRELVWTPPLDMPREDVRAANDQCLRTAYEARERTQVQMAAGQTYYPQAQGLYGGVGAAIGEGIAYGIMQRAAEGEAYDSALAHCFHEAGYVQIGLSGRERRQWRQAALLVRQQAFAGDLLRADPARAISPALLPERVGGMAVDKDGEATPAAAEMNEPGASDGKQPELEAPAEAIAINATVETSADAAEPAQAEPAAATP